MSVTLADRQRAPQPPDVVADSGRQGLALAVVLAVAAFLRLWPDLHGGGLTGVREYDDGVHYAAGLALLHGQLPYRSFTFLQPPGIAVVMTPIAALGTAIGQPAALAVARLLVVVLGLANTVMLARIGRQVSPTVGTVAAAVYAVFPGAVLAERTVLIEPFVTGCCLAAVLALGQGRDRRAGMWLAAALFFKLFAAAYVIALVVVGLRRATRIIAWLSATVVVLSVTFVLAAPGAMLRDVVVEQLRRPLSGPAGAATRLSDLTGATGMLGRPLPLPLVLVIVAGGAILLGWLVRNGEPARLWAVVGAVVILAFVLSSSYFSHYAEFFAPVVAMVVALTVNRLRRLARHVVAGALALVALSSLGHVTSLSVGPALDAATRSSDCVLSDMPSLLVSANRLHPPTARCPQPIDPRGTALLQAPGNQRPHFYPDGFHQLGGVQVWWRHAVRHATAVIIAGTLAQDPVLAPDTQEALRDAFVLRSSSVTGSWQIWMRR